jgi:DNA-directed RNA polymerase II subunit RPB1
MNIFVPQNVQTMGELMDLASVPYMVLAPRDGKPIVEVVQDTMLGAFRLTQDWVRIHDKTMANLQMVNSYFKGALPAPEEENSLYFTGRQAYSQILPPGLFIELRNKAGKKFKIVDSEITEGFIDKPIYHSISKGLLPVLYHDYSPFEVRRFLDNTQRLIMRWLASAGFSVGISDLVVDSDTTDRLKEAISNYKAKAYTKINDVRKGKLENNSILNNEDFFEREILNVLNDLTKVVGEIGMKKIDPKTNRMINMVKSGSKGKETNVAQMVACVGQQNVDGKRVAYGFTDRTLPHYTKYDDGPEARGFVENSFISGLTPQEVFFHAMGGREGLIDTAVKTSETGYIQRRLVKAMEDCKIYYDQTVRNATGAIVQFLYGEDGMDGTKIEKQSIPTIDMNQIQLDAMYHLRPEDNLSLYLTPEALREMEADATWAGRATQHFEDIMDDRRFLIEKVFHGQKNDKIHYPIPFERIIHTARQRLEAVGVKAVPSDLTPKYILDKIDDLKQRLKIMRPNQGIRFLHILLHIYLSPKPVLTQLNLSRATFDWITSEIERYFIASVGHPGEMVGIVAAQSFGELSTQQTLDSFHSSGTAAAVKATSGVPRLKELLSVSKNIKTPTLLIYMKPDIATVVNPVEDDDGNVSDSRVQEAKEKSMVIMKQLETTRLLDILESTEIYWDHPGEDGLDTGLDEDEGMIAVYRAFNQVHRCGSSSPWVLRMKLNKEKMYSLGLTMMDIYIRIHNAYKQHVECLFSDDNAKELILRVRLTREALKEVDAEDTVAALKAMEHNLVHNVLLKGMKGIKKVSMRLVNRDDYDQEEDKFHKVTEWTLDTDGTNLVEILANPNIDASRTRSNDIWEIYNTLGIEAARNALQREFNEVVGDDSLNYRHMSLLLDTMTNRGTLMSVDRHGINRGDVGPLAKCSFEETTDMLIKASIFSEQDRINGVSANIMLGQLPPCGTGDHEVLLDEEAYIRLLAERNATIPSETMQVIDENEVQVFDSVCGVEALQMPYSISNKPTKQMPMPKIAFV